MTGRWASAVVDLDAIRHNITVLRGNAGAAAVWAVVKADAYGHGAVPVARATLDAGATKLCVALAQEADELLDAGVRAPILVLTEQPIDQVAGLVDRAVELVAYTDGYLDAVADAAASTGRPAPVHVHVDTGMSRVGATAATAVALVDRVVGDPRLELAGLMTHLACADEPNRDATGVQLARFDALIADLRARGIDTGTVHAANSATGIAHPHGRYDAVRAGIAVYGISPGDGVDDRCGDLHPAMSLTARVSFVKDVPTGTRVNYGWRHTTAAPTRLATVPLGYADGVARRLGTGPDGEPGHDVLIGGRRHPIVGVVTMDQLVVDVGETPVAAGDEVVLIGVQGGDRIRAEDWAHHLGTIGYEIACGVNRRVPRVYVANR